MKKYRLKHLIHFLMVTVLVICTFSSIESKSVYAIEIGLTDEEKASDNDYVEVSAGVSAISVEYNKNKSTCSFNETLKNYFEKVDTSLRGSMESWIYFHYTKFNGLSESDQQDIIDCLTDSEVYESLTKTSQSDLLLMIDNKINFTNSGEINALFGQNRADMIGGYKLFAPFGSRFGVVLAVLAFLVSTALVLSVVIDLLYMYIPVAGSKMKDTAWMKFVSEGAKRAIHELETSGSSVECLKIYLTERLLSISVFVIALIYLLSNQIFFVFAKVLGLFNS